MRTLYTLSLSIFLSAFALLCYADDCQNQTFSYLTTSGESFAPFTDQSVSGIATWGYNSQYGAKIGSPNNEDWLISPVIDAREIKSMSFSFEHTYKYGEDPQKEMTLWATAYFTGDVTTTQWTQIPITQYSGNWKYISNSYEFPASLLGERSAIAFRYLSSANAYPTWQIKNFELKTYCQEKGPVESPVDLPDIGDGRLVICGQNLHNYYFNFADTDRPDYNSAAGFADKTHKIVNALLMVNADIYALCEIEAQDIILRQLADSLNTIAGEGTFDYVTDKISVPNSTGNNIKSGFIYRKSKVRPYGNNSQGSSQTYYCNTMRIQAFEELSTGARLTVSMNHFKAKDSSDDGGNSKRERNAQDLLASLKYKAADPDILIMGDLNCEYDEQPLQILVNAGYEEQLLRFDPYAYSYCYYGDTQLIDHVFANSTMASQISGAGVFHITTSCGQDGYFNYDYRYSDHDPYVVGVNLNPTTDLQNTTIESKRVRKIIVNSQLYIILSNQQVYDAWGRRVQ